MLIINEVHVNKETSLDTFIRKIIYFRNEESLLHRDEYDDLL